MNDYLSTLSNAYFSSYVSNVIPGTIDNDVKTFGALTIVDNTAENILSLIPGSLNVFVDDVFIASGYGFTNLRDYNTTSYLISTYNDVYNDIINRIEEVDNKSFSLEYSYQDYTNRFDTEYNGYGFLTSYKYLKLSYDSEYNSYNISAEMINDLGFIKNINVSKNSANPEFAEYTRDVQDNFNVDVSLNIYKQEIYNWDSASIKLNDTYMPRAATTHTFSFIKPNGKYDDDLKVECYVDDTLKFSYVYSDYLKWRDKFGYFPVTSDTTSADNNKFKNSSYLNFRDTTLNFENDQNSQDIKNGITALDAIVRRISTRGESFFEPYPTDNVITFNYGSDPMYDFLVFTTNYQNVEFYYNGIRSNNWKCKERTVLDDNNNVIGTVYIWQSPQRYVGEHSWTVRVK